MNSSLRYLIMLVGGLTISLVTSAQQYHHVSSSNQPYGSWNSESPVELKDYEPLIGSCDCKSVRRNPDGTWQDSIKMVWTFKYIMDGKAVMDETLKEDGGHSMSIRQYNADSAKWYVTYFAANSAAPSPGTWSGGKKGDDMVLYLPQKAPNGADGYARLTFYDISDEGYRWKGEWVDLNETVAFPFWTIDCSKTGNW
ncbi:MAG: hypothetical protein AAFN93_23620 [Bacteroidota bacterium]